MFLIVDLQSVFNMDVGMFMISLHTKFHMPVSSCSMVILIKPENKQNTWLTYCYFPS
jgi:hypothetical protein